MIVIITIYTTYTAQDDNTTTHPDNTTTHLDDTIPHSDDTTAHPNDTTVQDDAYPDDNTAHSYNTTVQDDDTLDSALTTAMKEGGGKMKPCNITLHGPPGVGKTSLKRLILGLPPLLKEEENSTNIMEKAVRAVSTHRLRRDGNNLLAAVDNEEFITMLAQTVGVVNEELQKKPPFDSTHDDMLVSQCCIIISL